MTVRVSVEVEDGAPVVRHVADHPDADQLRRTADRLAAAAGPGVVPVVASRAAGDGWELATAYVGPPVSATAAGTPERLAAIGAAVASTLATLHDRGLVHGRLERVHVLLGGDGTPVLAGLGPGDDAARPADDVAALGQLLMDLADELALGPRAADGDALARLDRVLTAAVGPIEGRPTARRLAAELDALDAASAVTTPRRRPRPFVLRLVGLVAVVALAVFVVSLAWTRGTSGGRRAVVVATSTVPPSIPVLPVCAALAGHRVVAATCGFEASVDGGFVEVDGVRSVVGRDDDEVAVGDWDCDGRAEPALVRPSTGEVLVFGPADGGGARPVVRATRVAGAWRFDLGDGEPGCAALRVVDRAGRVVPIEGLARSIPS